MKKLFLLITAVLLMLFMAVNINAAGKQFTAIMGLLKVPEDGLKEVLAEFKKLTGVELKLLLHDYNEEKTKLSIAAGDIPDLLDVPTGLYATYAAEGLFIDLTKMVEKSKYVKNLPKELLDSYRTKDGKILAIPYMNGGGCVGYFRKDWLDKLGMQVPKTYDQLVEVMRAFTTKDPDGDGQQNTYGYTTLVDDSFDAWSRLILHDAFMDITYKDGKWIDGMSDQSMIAALKRLKALYDEKLIDPQFITAKKTSEFRSKLIEGKVGILEYWAGEWGMNLSEYAKKANPKAVVRSMPAVEGARYKNRLPQCLAITIKAKNPQIIFDSFIEGLFDNDKRQILWTYGVENVHWAKKGNTVEFLPLITDKTRLFKKTKIAREFQLNDMPLMIPLEETVSGSMANQINTFHEKVVPSSEIYGKNIGDLNNLKKEIILKVVTGAYPTVEEGIAAYKERAEKEMKLSEIIKDLNSK